jgi:uncharacterized protein (DUF362 family)
MAGRIPRRRLALGLVLVTLIWLVGATHELIRRARASGSEGLVTVGFSWQQDEPTDQQVRDMVDDVIEQVLGPGGLASIIEPGDKVVIKTNIVGSGWGQAEERGRGMITDPRIMRYIAEKVRDIIGFGGSADLKVVDACYYPDTNPSVDTPLLLGFYWAWLERTGNDSKDPGDVCYDYDADGILDGGSNAQLVNLDAIDESGRFVTTVNEPSLGAVDVYLPKFLRTRQQAQDAGEPDEYCDVLIGLPVFKSHTIAGMTGAVKLHYGFRYRDTGLGLFPGEDGRTTHSGTLVTGFGGLVIGGQFLDEYLSAQHRVRSYDFVLMDALTANRRGPITPDGAPFTPVDYFLVHAMMASTDPVAIDTVATLLAGYDQSTVEFLERGRLDGLGVNTPERIRVAGLTEFGEHRDFLYDTYNPSGLYPFEQSWGNALLMSDFSPPTGVTVSQPTYLTAEDVFAFTYTAEEGDGEDLGLARIEFLMDGELVDYRNTDLTSSGEIRLDLSGYTAASHSYSIAAWDKAFNCAVSEEAVFDVQLLPTITAQPASQLVDLDESVQFTVTVSGAGPFSYQWRKDGVDIPGANSPTYVISAVQGAHEGVYTCLVTNDAGSVESDLAVLSVSIPIPLITRPLLFILVLLCLSPVVMWWVRRQRSCGALDARSRDLNIPG